MKTPLVLFFGLIVATAFIAYWSDNLGKKLGKKRVSLMGLRPRTTATVLTIGSSWLIMLFTLAAMLVAWPQLGKALFTFDNVQRQTRQLQDQSEALRERVSAAQKEIRAKELATRSAEDKLQGTRTNLDQTVNRLQRATASLKTARAGEVRARASEQEARSRELRARQGEARAERLAQNALIRQEAAQDRLGALEARFLQARERLATTQSSLQRVQGALAAVQGRLDSARGKLSAAYRANSALSQREISLRSDVADLNSQRAELETQVKTLREDSEYYSGIAEEFRQRMMLYGHKPPRLVINQVLAERTLPAGMARAQVTQILQELLEEGQVVMPSYEVSPGGEQAGTGRAVQAKLSLFRLFWSVGPNPTPLTRDEVFRLVAQMVTSMGDGVSLRLVAARNYFEGEREMEGRFVVVPVNPAYRSGEVIVTDRIDGKGDDALIFKALLDLIEKGREAASERRVNPPLSPQKPDFYAPDTKQRLFEALRRLETLKRPASVSIVAAADQTTVEPLRVRFEVN